MANNQTNAGTSKQDNDYVEKTILQAAIQRVDTLLNPFYNNIINGKNQLQLLQAERDFYFNEWDDILNAHGQSYDRLHDMIKVPNYNKEEFACLLELRAASQRRIEELKQKARDLEERIRYSSPPSPEEVIQLRQKAKAQEEVVRSFQPSTEFVKDALVFKNLSWSLNEQDARRRISHDLNLPFPRAWNYHKDKNTNAFTGISFANYETVEEARQVYEYFNNSEHIIEERVVKVEYKIQKPAAEDGNSRRGKSTFHNSLQSGTGGSDADQDLGVLGSNLRFAGSTQMDLAPYQNIYGIATGAQPLPILTVGEQDGTLNQNTASQNAGYFTPQQAINSNIIQSQAIPALQVNQTYIQHIPQQQSNNSNNNMTQSDSTFSGAASPFAISSPSNQNNIQSYQRQSQQTVFPQTNIGNIGNIGQTYSKISPEAYSYGQRFTPLSAQDNALHPNPNTSFGTHQQAGISNSQTAPIQFSPAASNPQRFSDLNSNINITRTGFESIGALGATPFVNPPSMPRMPGTSVPSALQNGNEAGDNTNVGIIGQGRRRN